jgi:hypothetical protein
MNGGTRDADFMHSLHGVRKAIRGGSECLARCPRAAGFASNGSARTPCTAFARYGATVENAVE